MVPMDAETSTARPEVRAGFHEGELAVQELAGVRAAASRLSRMVDPADLTGGAAAFLGGQTFAVLSGRDRDGRLWLSPLTGPPGFLSVSGPHTLHVAAGPGRGDPLHLLPGDQSVGLLVLDPARRRRFRVNGWLTTTSSSTAPDVDVLTIEADQAFGNCPQYIQQRWLAPVSSVDDQGAAVGEPPGGRGDEDRLSEADIAQIGAADTFFLGTAHPERGGDASHRGGAPGSTRVVDDRHLWWPDHPGNNMFNSLGNLAVDPTCALLWCDFVTGRTLHLSGTAALELTAPGSAGDDGGTGRRVRFRVEQVLRGPLLPVRDTSATAHPTHEVHDVPLR